MNIWLVLVIAIVSLALPWAIRGYLEWREENREIDEMMAAADETLARSRKELASMRKPEPPAPIAPDNPPGYTSVMR